MREQLREFYPEAKVAYLKSGGNFPYLSHSDQVVMFIRVRARRAEFSTAIRALNLLRPASNLVIAPRRSIFASTRSRVLRRSSTARTRRTASP